MASGAAFRGRRLSPGRWVGSQHNASDQGHDAVVRVWARWTGCCGTRVDRDLRLRRGRQEGGDPLRHRQAAEAVQADQRQAEDDAVRDRQGPADVGDQADRQATHPRQGLPLLREGLEEREGGQQVLRRGQRERDEPRDEVVAQGFDPRSNADRPSRRMTLYWAPRGKRPPRGAGRIIYLAVYCG